MRTVSLAGNYVRGLKLHECLTLLLACANFAFITGTTDSHEGFFAAGPSDTRGKKVYLLFVVALIALLLVVGALYKVVAAANDAQQPPPGSMVDVGGLPALLALVAFVFHMKGVHHVCV
jgi:hypothetical protein